MVDNGKAVRAVILAPEILRTLLREHLKTLTGVQVVDGAEADVVVLMGRGWRRRFLVWRDANPEVPSVLVTAAEDPDLCVSIALGIDAVVNSDEGMEEITAAIFAASGGRGYESPGMHAALRLAHPGGASAEGWSGLTPTERVIALDAGRGLSGKRIAQLHGISEVTVKTHLSRVYAKLSLTGKASLVRYISGRGLENDG